MDLGQPRLQLPPVYKRIDAPLTALTFIERAATSYIQTDWPLLWTFRFRRCPPEPNPLGGGCDIATLTC
jgi:hypothetical protein